MIRAGAAAAAVLVALLAAIPTAPAGEPLVGDMPRVRLAVDGTTWDVRLAATARHRAAGFQHVPAAAMADTAIYFRYRRPTRPSYHMRNVARPLLLAWIAPDGRVRDVIRMQPGSTGHSPRQPVIAVLEFTEAHALAGRVRPGVTVTPVSAP